MGRFMESSATAEDGRSSTAEGGRLAAQRTEEVERNSAFVPPRFRLRFASTRQGDAGRGHRRRDIPTIGATYFQ